MNMSLQAGVGLTQSSDVMQTQEVRMDVRVAIAHKKHFEEQLIGNDLDQEADEVDLHDEVDDLNESVEDEPDPNLPNENLTGQPADSGNGTDFEPQDHEDVGDSDGFLADDDSDSLFDQERTGNCPLISQLPRQARPIVRFAIDADYGICALDLLDDPQFELRRFIALAVARHMKRHKVELCAPGDWCRIPTIGSDDELLRLAVADSDDEARVETLIELRAAARKAQKALQRFQSEQKASEKKGHHLDPHGKEEKQLKETRSELQSKEKQQLAVFNEQFQRFCSHLKDYGAHLKTMGVRLPNGDVVTVAVLMDSARQGKRATLAAAFRTAEIRPQELADEPWTPDDWNGFEESQRKAKYRKKTSSQ